MAIKFSNINLEVLDLTTNAINANIKVSHVAVKRS